MYLFIAKFICLVFVKLFVTIYLFYVPIYDHYLYLQIYSMGHISLLQ